MTISSFGTFTRSDRKRCCAVRKLIFGLWAVMTLVFMVGSAASAQETPSEDPTTTTTTTTTVEEEVLASCGPPETLTYVRDEANQRDQVYNADGQLCVLVAPGGAVQFNEQPGSEVVPTPAPVPRRQKLARTGFGLMASALVGFGLLLAGLPLSLAEKKRPTSG